MPQAKMNRKQRIAVKQSGRAKLRVESKRSLTVPRMASVSEGKCKFRVAVRSKSGYLKCKSV